MTIDDTVIESGPAVTLTGPPPLTDLVLEVPRALIDLQRLVALAPLLRVAPAGDGHPVLVVPGFLGGDVTTAPVRAFLRLGGCVVARRLRDAVRGADLAAGPSVPDEGGTHDDADHAEAGEQCGDTEGKLQGAVRRRPDSELSDKGMSGAPNEESSGSPVDLPDGRRCR